MGQNTNTPSSPVPWKEFLTFIGVVITAYIGYLGIRSQTEIPIKTTQTAEAKQILTPQVIIITPESNSIPKESIPTTLTSTPIPKFILHEFGRIYFGIGNQWRFSTEISPIKINVKLDTPPSTCEVEVSLWDRDAERIIFEEAILYSETNYSAFVTTAPNGNYTVVVGVPKPNSKPNCTESEIYSFEITISP